LGRSGFGARISATRRVEDGGGENQGAHAAHGDEIRG
jgi:hypothetical protein